MELGEGWNHVVRGGRVAKASTTPPANPHPNPTPQQVTKATEQPKVTATRETARPQKHEPKSTAAPKRSAGKSKKKAAASVKAAAAKTTPPNLVVPTQISTSPLEEISDLLDHLTTLLVWTDSSAPRVLLLPPHRDSSPAGCPEVRNPFRCRIWRHALGGRNGENPCASLAGMRKECAAESSNWSIFSASTVSIFVS
jgi:hypothetical protein